MKFSLIPGLQLDSILELKPAFLKNRGVSLLLLDLDNTLAPYSEPLPSKAVRYWTAEMKREGISLFLISNNGSERPAVYAKALGLPYIHRAKKPGTGNIRKIMEQSGKSPAETALAGDQLFTDVLGANRAGVFSIVVKPLELKNPLLRLRYGLELPLRAMGKRGKNDDTRTGEE